jgi:hypothetical protein
MTNEQTHARIAALEADRTEAMIAVGLTGYDHREDINTPAQAIYALWADMTALRAELAASKGREAALAAAIQPFAEFGNRMLADDDYTYMQDRVTDWLGVSDFKNALTAYACAAPILARVRRDAKREALEALPGYRFSDTGHDDDCYGPWNAYADAVRKALAALDAEEAQNA